MLLRNIRRHFFTLCMSSPHRYAPRGSMGLLGCCEAISRAQKRFVLAFVLPIG